MDEHDMMMEEFLWPTVEDAPFEEQLACGEDEDEDDGQPSELQENEDFAHDDYFSNMCADEMM